MSRFRVQLLLAFVVVAVAGSFPASPARGAFPGRNGKIVFARWPRSSQPYERIFTIRANGTGLRQLTTGSTPRSDVNPEWRHDGRRILFTRDTVAGSTRFVIMRPNGTVESSIGRPGSLDFMCCATWDPTGTRIGFAGGRIVGDDPVWDIYSMTVAGGDLKQLTDDASFEQWPDWSADGSAIAFDRQVELAGGGVRFEVWKVTLDGSGNPTGEVRLAGGPSQNAIHADWKPDSSGIVYSCQSRGPLRDQEICTAPAGGGSFTRIVANGASVDAWPAYSPNGRAVVWQSGENTGDEVDTELKVLVLATGRIRNLVGGPVVNQQPDWQPRT